MAHNFHQILNTLSFSVAPRDGVDGFVKPLNVKYGRRPYLSEQDAIYDFHSGHEWYVTDAFSPYHGCSVTVLDAAQLLRDGYTSLSLTYNHGRPATSVPLVRYS